MQKLMKKEATVTMNVVWSCLCLLLAARDVAPELEVDSENVCPRKEEYMQAVTVWEMVPVTIKTYKWCFKLPPRCSVYKTEYQGRWVNKQIPKTRMVAECCKGYAVNVHETKCIAVCSISCIHGVCTEPDICSCEPGYTGSQCQDNCSDNKWGRQCSQECVCEHDSSCHHVTGYCFCNIGWQGTRCESPCSKGQYGVLCQQKCQCENAECHHITGACRSSPTTIVTTEASTTEDTTSASLTEEVTITPTEPSSVVTTTRESTKSEEVVSITELTPALETTLLHLTKTTDIISSTDSATSPELVTTETTNTEPTVLNTTSKDLNIFTRPIEIQVTTETKQRDDSTTSEYRSTTTLKTTTSRLSELLTPNISENAIDRGSFEEATSTPFYKLLPGLSIGAGVAVVVILILILVTMLTHHKKMKKLEEKKKNILPTSLDLGIHKYYGSSDGCGILPVQTLFENPVYSSCDEVILRETPSLKSFRPDSLTEEELEKEKQKKLEILRRTLEEHYDHPVSSKSELFVGNQDEHVYDEIPGNYPVRPSTFPGG